MPRKKKAPGALPAPIQSAELRSAAGVLANQVRAKEAKEALVRRNANRNEMQALYRSLAIPVCSRPIWRFVMRIIAETIVEAEGKLLPPSWRPLDDDELLDIETRVSYTPLELESEAHCAFGGIQLPWWPGGPYLHFDLP